MCDIAGIFGKKTSDFYVINNLVNLKIKNAR